MDSDLINAIKSNKTEVPKDKLDAIRNMGRAMRDLTKEIADLEERVKEKKAELNRIQMNDLVMLMEENQVPKITIEAEGNYPRYDLEAKPYYHAVLPRNKETGLVLEEGTSWLKKNGAGDLIKRVFVVTLGMDSDKQVAALRKFLMGPPPKGKKKVLVPKYRFEEKEDVPWATLTSFVKERIEKLKKPVPLETLGATIGKIVRMKEVKSQ